MLSCNFVEWMEHIMRRFNNQLRICTTFIRTVYAQLKCLAKQLDYCHFVHLSVYLFLYMFNMTMMLLSFRLIARKCTNQVLFNEFTIAIWLFSMAFHCESECARSNSVLMAFHRTKNKQQLSNKILNSSLDFRLLRYDCVRAREWEFNFPQNDKWKRRKRQFTLRFIRF